MSTVKKKFKILDMHCSSCALTIDMDLEDLDGVQKAQTSYARSVIEVEFDPQKVSENLILETVKRAGYSAQIQNGD